MNVGNNNGYDSTARYVAYFSLFLVIILVVLIIVFALYYFQSPAVVEEVSKTWSVQAGLTTTGEPYTAAPNSIYLVNNTLTGPFSVKVVAYSTIATDVTSGKTTIFTINNTVATSPLADVTITGVTVQGTVTPAANVVLHGTSGQYMWVDATTIRRLF
jgi:Flp pilus assembly protein TadG